MICFSPHNLAYFRQFSSSIAKCDGGNETKCVLCQIDAFTARTYTSLDVSF